jgi:hypothetical protein
MVRIIVTEEAYRAISGAEPPRHMLAPEGGGYSLWLEKPVLASLRAARGHGESYSDVIVRMAKEAA